VFSVYLEIQTMGKQLVRYSYHLSTDPFELHNAERVLCTRKHYLTINIYEINVLNIHLVSKSKKSKIIPAKGRRGL
jgi:hypothetical protein